MSDNRIIIYTEKLSPFSRYLERDLMKAGIQPEIKRVDEDMAALVEMYNLTHAIHTPVIRIITDTDEVVLTGYSKENKRTIEQLLEVTL